MIKHLILTRNTREDEHSTMFTAQLVDEKCTTTDFIFNHDKTLKAILSEMDKEELKYFLCQIVDEYYQSY